MKFFTDFFKNKFSKTDTDKNEQSVIVHFDYLGGADLSQLFELENELREIIESKNIGEYDGNEIAMEGNDGSLFMYGPDANVIFDEIKNVLASSNIIENVRVVFGYGSGIEDKILKL